MFFSEPDPLYRCMCKFWVFFATTNMRTFRNGNTGNEMVGTCAYWG